MPIDRGMNKEDVVCICCYCSVAKSCPTLVTSWTIAHQALLSSTISRNLFKFMPIKLVMLSNQLILCWPFCFSLWFFPASVSLPTSWHFASGGQSVEASPLATYTPWLTDLISLQNNLLQHCNPKAWIIWFSAFLWSNFYICTWLTTGKS